MKSIYRIASRFVFSAAFFAAATGSEAEELSFYRGSSWEIALIMPGDGNDHGDRPYCEVRTVALEPMLIAIQYLPTKEAGKYSLNVKLRKSGWHLPVGKTTAIGVAPVMSDGVYGPDPEFKAVSEDTLVSDLTTLDEKWFPLQVKSISTQIFSPTRYRFGLSVNFPSGNEESWQAESVAQFEQQIALDARRSCLSEISKWLATQGGEAPASSTSPF